MAIAAFGALWFVRKRLLLPGDNPERATPDRPLTVTDPKGLAVALGQRINGAELRLGAPGATLLTVDTDGLLADCEQWDSIFEVADSILARSRVDGDSADGDALKAAYGGFLVLRWVWADEGGSLIVRYPDTNPPLTGGTLEKRILARIIQSRLDDAKLKLDEPKKFLAGSSQWGGRFDVLDAVLARVA